MEPPPHTHISELFFESQQAAIEKAFSMRLLVETIPSNSPLPSVQVSEF